MKKIIWSMLLTMVFCIGLCPLKARADGTTFNVDTDGRYNGSSGTFDVTVSGGEVTIKRNESFYIWLPEDLTVPTTVYDENGTQYTVTNLGESCLSDCDLLESVKLPDNITWIPNNCFFNCTSLKTISIPEGVGSIGSNAFQGCSALENVELPNSLTTISGGAFSNCTNLKSIKLPDNVSTIAGGAFDVCSNLKSVTLSVPSKLQATDDPFSNTPLITEGAGSVLLYSAQGVSDKATDFEGTYDIFTDPNNYKVPGGNIYCASYKADSGLDVTTTTDASGSVPVLVCEVTGADRVYAKVDGKTTAIDAENGKCTYRIKAVKYDSSDEIVPVIFSLEDDGNGSSGSNDDKKGSGDDSSSQSDYNYLEKLDSVLNDSIKKGGAQTVEWNEGTTLSYEIMKTLEQNPNITLVFSYRWNNVNYRVVIPGRMVKADKNIPYYGPAYLYKYYGANAVAIKANDANVSHSYTVEKGDTLSTLARRLHIGIDRLVSLNKISNPNLIKEGQVLVY